MCNAKTGKIFVDITEGEKEKAVEFFQKKVPGLFPYLVLIEQRPMDFIGDNCFSASSEHTVPYLARKALEAGNELLPVTDFSIDISRLCQRKKSLEDIMRSDVGMQTSTASSAGFVIDQDGKVYKLTVRHPFHGKRDKKWVPTQGKGSDKVAVLTEIIRTKLGQDCGEVIHVGDELHSAFLPHKVTEDDYKAVDIALIEVRSEILSHPCLQLDRMNNKGEKMSVEVYEGSDRNLLGKEVEKTGAITERTCGKIILADQDIYIGGIPWGGTFLVQSTGRRDKFAQQGDSGSLVTEQVHHQAKLAALGMCFMVGDYEDRQNETKVIKYKDVTRCVGLQHCFAFSRTELNRSLKFCSSEDLKSKEGIYFCSLI